MKVIRFMDVSFRDGFQSVLGARVRTADFLPALQAAAEAGTRTFEIGGGARFQSPYFYCQEDAFESMDACRAAVGPDMDLRSLARGINVVGLSAQPSDVIDLHAKLFRRHGISSIRNFDALNDVRNLDYSGRCIVRHGLKHQIAITLMGLPPGVQDPYPHSAAFYTDRLKAILAADIPFHSLCFKDASGTTPPRVVYETVKAARRLLPDGMEIEFHTHCTADSGVACHLAAIEAGADTVDLAMAPMSGGTGAPDILTLWHVLKGSDYTLDIDYEKVLRAEEVFADCMARYFIPPEAKETNPLITLSPMPGGALTANTQMMRDTGCLERFPEVIQAMREVVERGGYGTSVTPVSQFYFQQAFLNVMQGPWKKINKGYGELVLGYFGRTPAAPDPEIVRLAAEQLGRPPTEESPLVINDADPRLGLAAARQRLRDAGLPETEENQFILATCEDKGLAFLKGERPLGIRFRDPPPAKAPAGAPALAPAAPPTKAPSAAGPAAAGEAVPYTVTVNGRAYAVTVAAGDGAVRIAAATTPAAPAPASSAPAPAEAAPAHAAREVVKAPMPGTVIKVLVRTGEQAAPKATLLVLEAMKMEIEVKCAHGGTVLSLGVAPGDTVQADQPLVSLG
jgi:pyruvate carboxylase subunit B